MHGSSPDDSAALLPALVEEAGDHHAVVNIHADAPGFFVEFRLDVVAPDADDVTVFIIVSEHQLRFFVAEVGALELIVDVPYPDAHLLAFLQGIPAFLRNDIADVGAGIALHGVVAGFRVRFRGDPGAGIGDGAVPVVDTRAAGAAPLGVPPLRHGYLYAFFAGVNRRLHTGHSAADNEDVGIHFVDLVVVDGIGPFRDFAGLLDVLMPGAHDCPPSRLLE